MDTGQTVSPKVVAFHSVIAAVGIMYVLVAAVIVHFLQPDLPLLSSPISQYAVGPYGVLFAIALLVWGIASLILAIGLYRNVCPSRPLRVGIFLLVVFGTGLIIASIFPMDVPFPPKNFFPESFTAIGLTHILSATISSVCFPFSALFLSMSFQKDERWKLFQPLAHIVALSTLGALASFFIISGVDIRFFGIGQKIFAALVLLWLLLTTVRLFEYRKFPHNRGACVALD